MTNTDVGALRGLRSDASLDACRRMAAVAGRDLVDPLAEFDWHLLDDPGLGAIDLPGDPLASAASYAELDEAGRQEVGRARVADVFVAAIEFERELQRALLAYTATLTPGAAEFEFVYHEVAEEARHSQMFARFAARVGASRGAAPLVRAHVQRARYGRHADRAPELLFLATIAGEEAVDTAQRRMIDRPVDGVHPVLRQVCDLHIREEARHLSYGRLLLREVVPRLPDKRRRRFELAAAPLVLETAWVMLAGTLPALVEQTRLDRGALGEPAVVEAIASHVFGATRRTRRLCRDLGVWPSWAPTTAAAWTPPPPAGHIAEGSPSGRRPPSAPAS